MRTRPGFTASAGGATAARTPFGAGEPWPERVDSFLTVEESAVERWVPPRVLCSNGCGLEIALAGGRIVSVGGHAGDRVNHERLGPKGHDGQQSTPARPSG